MEHDEQESLNPYQSPTAEGGPAANPKSNVRGRDLIVFSAAIACCSSLMACAVMAESIHDKYVFGAPAALTGWLVVLYMAQRASLKYMMWGLVLGPAVCWPALLYDEPDAVLIFIVAGAIVSLMLCLLFALVRWLILAITT
ncbi:MAG: hypothetical protein KJZ70_19105 [Bryobacterales bacterium]|nr:hypothetical protein [Bryobacterales bacterium]